MPRSSQISKLVGAMIAAFALTSCDNHKSGNETKSEAKAIDYGVLGKPDPSQFTDLDADIVKRSPEDTLALYRNNERHPPQGTEDHPVEWDEIAEHEDYQRTLFYIAAEGAPQSITSDDWHHVRDEEKDLISSSCDNAGSAAARYQLPQNDCARAAAP